MLKRRVGVVRRILTEGCTRQAQEIIVEIDGKEERALNYPHLTGCVSPGDSVLANTTACALSLGTGGLHFVMANLSNPEGEDAAAPGHIMKLRYTPNQLAVLSVEEQESPNHKNMAGFVSLDGMPVVCCELHSQIAGVAAGVKQAHPSAHVSYIMTDEAALPLALSNLAAALRIKGLIDSTITCGQAFGGEIEAVNLFSALAAAKDVLHADIAIICQGPGNTGTGTPLGFSGIAQGTAANTAGSIGGRPVIIPRISFADKRERHRGISHHTLTVLEMVLLVPSFVPVPRLSDDCARIIQTQMEALECRVQHKFVPDIDGRPGLNELERQGVRVQTMGRSVQEDREFFLSTSAGGVLAAELI
jgi:hypothetical protein